MRAEWGRKNCAGKRGAREFFTGGPESGTLAGARRAEGLFDYNWGTEFPLTRDEQKALQEGRAVPDPFFAPPTTANPGNYIKSRIDRLRAKQNPTLYMTAEDIAQLCRPAGSGITCEGPNGGMSWTSTTAQLTPADVNRFRDAYCQPNTCARPGTATPPPGFTERAITTKPRNPAVAGRARCESAPITPILTTKPIPSTPPPPPPPVDYACTGYEQSCVGVNCLVGTESRTMRWRSDVPPAIVSAWAAANCRY